MNEEEEMAELRAQEARRVRDEAKKCLRHASFQLGKAAYEIDEYLKEFSTARIPISSSSTLAARFFAPNSTKTLEKSKS